MRIWMGAGERNYQASANEIAPRVRSKPLAQELTDPAGDESRSAGEPGGRPRQMAAH